MSLRLGFRMALAAGAGPLAAAAAVVAVPAAPASASGAASARARPVSGCESGSVPALSVTAARPPRVTGSVLVAASGRRITVGAATGARTDVQTTATAAWLEFCLRAAAVTKPVTLVTVAPGGVSVALGPNHKLTVSRVSGARRSTTTTISAAGRAALVQVLLDRRHGRVSLFIDNGRPTTVPAAVSAAVHVYVGASASAAPTAGAVPAIGAGGNGPVAFAAGVPSGAHF
jgi:hypothetical protein